MAVVDKKSTIITNRDATPVVFANSVNQKAQINGSYAYVTFASGDSANSIGRILSVPSNARVHSLHVVCGALGGSCAGDIGVYRNTKDGGAVVDADFFASAVSFVSALTHTDVINESGVNNVTKQSQPIWQALGLTEDPQSTFDICVTLTADTAANNSIGLALGYAV